MTASNVQEISWAIRLRSDSAAPAMRREFEEDWGGRSTFSVGGRRGTGGLDSLPACGQATVFAAESDSRPIAPSYFHYTKDQRQCSRVYGNKEQGYFTGAEHSPSMPSIIRARAGRAMAGPTNVGNHFLTSLSSADTELLRPHLVSVQLEVGETLHEQMETISQVYFVDSGVVSLVVGLSDGTSVEAGMFGVNGVVGGGSALDGQLSLSHSIVQVAGSARRISSNVLKRVANESEALRSMLFSSEQVHTALAQQVAACNAMHELEQRLARWLLMLRDLSGRDTLLLRQEFLAQMLGVQRTSVSLVARHLQTAGLIKYRRGRIDNLDVEGLNETACECYATINQYYKRLIGWQPLTAGGE